MALTRGQQKTAAVLGAALVALLLNGILSLYFAAADAALPLVAWSTAFLLFGWEIYSISLADQATISETIWTLFVIQPWPLVLIWGYANLVTGWYLARLGDRRVLAVSIGLSLLYWLGAHFFAESRIIYDRLRGGR